MTIRSLILGGAAAVALAAPAMAQTAATATTDLNFRAGPGPGFEVVGVIPASAAVDVQGCLDDQSWCEVMYEGAQGWAYGPYLSATDDQMPVKPMGTDQPATQVTVNTVTYEPENSDNEAALGLGVTGAAAGFAIGGPIGALAGAAAGLVGGPLTNPDGEVVTYVTANPVEPVYAEGEVVVGATVPPELTLYDTPADELRYANINGQQVLVEPGERQIVYIVR